MAFATLIDADRRVKPDRAADRGRVGIRQSERSLTRTGPSRFHASLAVVPCSGSDRGRRAEESMFVGIRHVRVATLVGFAGATVAFMVATTLPASAIAHGTPVAEGQYGFATKLT